MEQAVELTELKRKYECICCLTTFMNTRDSSRSEAIKLILTASAQLSQKVTLMDLAKFKYLLSDEIGFEYEDTPFDVAFGSKPTQVLVFKYNDKKGRIRKPSETAKVIKGRIERFNNSLNTFLVDHSLEVLDTLATELLPDDPFNDPAQADLDGSSDKLNMDAIRLELEVNAVSLRTTPGRTLKNGPVPSIYCDTLDSQGYENIYSHQSLALHALADDHKHVVVSTPTASGKSLIFHTPVLHMLREDEDGTALFIYPTKALAQDQLRALSAVAPIGTCRTLDGDTPFQDREYIAQNARVIFCNPDIIHVSMLPQADKWMRVLSNLKYVIIDEVHYYGGVFGGQVGLVMRRLRRMVHQLGAEPLFIGCSATIDKPKAHMAALTGLPADEITSIEADDDGSPAGMKHYVFLSSCYMTPNDPSSGRVHPIREAAPIMEKLVRNGLRVISFCRFRKDCELLLKAVYDRNPDLRRAVKGYRSGYSAEDRRAIEADMFSGEIRGIVCTSALEVGIDIGDLDAVLIVGFPHSLASFRQQVGRVGRRHKSSLAVYIADGSVLDETYAHDIVKVLDSPIPHTPILMHPSIIRGHIRCAANELAFCGPEDPDFKFFPDFDLAVAKLVEVPESKELIWTQRPDFSIRKVNEAETLVINITDQSHPNVLECVPFSRVAFTLYEGAVYVHQGRSYLVVQLDGDLKFAKVQRTTVKWHTRQRDFTDVDPLRSKSSRMLEPFCQVNYGQVRVKTVVFGYFKFDQSNRIIDAVDVNLPPYEGLRAGSWINLDTSILQTLKERQYHLAGSIHAAEHAIQSVLPVFADMEPGDIATECKAPEKEFSSRQTNRIRPARLIFYERRGGNYGYGILKVAYDNMDEVAKLACDVVDKCQCELGCASCCASGQCTEHNAVLSKRGAQLILRSLLGRDLEGIPLGPEPNLPRAKIETVCAVEAMQTPATQTDAKGLKRQSDEPNNNNSKR